MSYIIIKPWDMLLRISPFLKDVKGMKEFIENQDHIKFEQYDNNNDIDGFNKMRNQGKLNCMVVHQSLSRGVFEWDNFNEWLISREDIILPDDIQNIDDINKLSNIN